MYTVDDLADAVERLRSLPSFSVASVEAALGVTLERKADANRYFFFHFAKPPAGPFSVVEYQEPSPAGKSRYQKVALDLRSGVHIPFGSLVEVYGAGELFDVEDRAEPDGMVIHRYDLGDQTLYVTTNARTTDVLGLVVARGEER